MPSDVIDDGYLQKLKETERERMNKLEEFERKANVQLERQLVMASEWSRALLTMRGKLKGTEWDPVGSHQINYSDFKRLLDSNNVQFMEYSNYGQTVSGWTSPYLVVILMHIPHFGLITKWSNLVRPRMLSNIYPHLVNISEVSH